MKSLLVSLVFLCAMTGMAYSQSSVPPSLLVGSFEMLSNGDGPVGVLAVYDVMGRRVATLVERFLPPGRHTIPWDATPLPTGVYFYRITAGDFVAVRQMLLIK